MPQVNLKVTETGAAQAGSAMKGLWGQIALGGIATQALQKGFEFLKSTIIDSTKETANQRNADIELANATGINIAQLKQFASQMQDLTNTADDRVEGIMALAASYGIQNDKLEDATQKTLGLSSALKVSEETALKAYKLALDGNIEGLKRLSPEFRNVTTQQEALNLINSKTEIGMKNLTQQSQTYEGRQRALANTFSDMKENLGIYVELVGTDLVNNTIKSTAAIRDFLGQSENVGKIGGTWEVVKTVFSSLVDTVKGGFLESFNSVRKSVGDFVKSLTDLLPAGAQNISVFDVLGAAIKGVGIVFGIMIKMTALFITSTLDLRTAINESIKLLILFGEALFNPSKWSEVKKQFEETKQSFSNFGANLVNNAGKIITETIDEFKKLPVESHKISTDLAEEYKTGFDKAKQSADDFNNGVIADVKNTNKNIDASNNEMVEKTKDVLSQTASIASQASSAAASVISGINERIKEQFDQQLEAIASYWEEVNAQADAAYAYQKELLENDGMTKEESLNSNLQKALLAGNQEKIAEAKKQLDLFNLDKDYNAKKVANQKQADDQSKNIKRQAWYAEQASAGTQAGIAYALGLIQLWSSSMSLGPIVGPILAGIMTAVLTGVFAANLALILTKQPGFAAGGIVPGTSFTGDNVSANVNSGEMILNQMQQKNLFDQIDQNNFKQKENPIQQIIINIAEIILPNVQNASDFNEQLLELARAQSQR